MILTSVTSKVRKASADVQEAEDIMEEARDLSTIANVLREKAKSVFGHLISHLELSEMSVESVDRDLRLVSVYSNGRKTFVDEDQGGLSGCERVKRVRELEMVNR